jgi:carbon storage regulator CsrA
MLVLRRKQNESVVIGDEVTLTVEDVYDGDDGRRIFGATVRFGFQSPQYVSIFRDELLRKGSGAARARKPAKPAPPRPGKVVDIPDAQVRLRIEVPQRIPVCCNGEPSVGLDPEEIYDRETHASTAVHHVTCHKGDRITICGNITIATLDFQRFVASEHNS